MKFTFGIATTDTAQRMSGNTNNHVSDIVDSIRANNIPNNCYEIIIVGGDNKYQHFHDVHHIEFDDITKPKWITKKKNLITKHAKYDNIVYSHDYVKYDNI